MLAIGTTEYGHWFMFGPLLVLFCGPWRSVAGMITAMIALAAAALFSSTLVSATLTARHLPGELAGAFGEASVKESPLSILKLWFGSREPGAAPDSIIYSTHGEDSLRMDFYRSSAGGNVPSPCVIVLHTGGWSNGTPNEFVAMNRHLASRGFAVAAIEYRLAPRWKWPAQREDVQAAMKYLTEHSAELGVDASRIVLLGRSAGGHIAEAAAYSLGDPAIRGCIAFYSPADMNFAYRYAKEDDILKSPQLLRDFLGGTPEQAQANYDDASAIRFVKASSPPTLLLHGGHDALVWVKQSERLDAELARMGVKHLFIRLPLATHAFDYSFNSPDGQLSTYAVDYFLAAIFR
jgi:acetyl esterase/lipase